MKDIKNYPLRLAPETYAKLQKRAKENKRSLNSEINMILEFAVNPIQVIGTIKDGGVDWARSTRAEFEEYKKGILDPRD